MGMDKKPMPVGVEDFKELKEYYYFVDKTRFVKELLDDRGKVTLITRPRRFGKTLTLSMLKYFFSLEDAGENRQLFSGLDIEAAGEAYMREQGTRPVVFLTLKDMAARDFSSMLRLMAIKLQEVYEEFAYMAEGGSLSAPVARYFERIRDGEGSSSQAHTGMSEQNITREEILDMFNTLPDLGEKAYFAEVIRDGKF